MDIPWEVSRGHSRDEIPPEGPNLNLRWMKRMMVNPEKVAEVTSEVMLAHCGGNARKAGDMQWARQTGHASIKKLTHGRFGFCRIVRTIRLNLGTAVIREPYVRWCERVEVMGNSFAVSAGLKVDRYFTLLDSNYYYAAISCFLNKYPPQSDIRLRFILCSRDQ